MKLGISFGNFSWPVPDAALGARFSGLARAADQAGIDSLFVMDHLFQIAPTGEPPEARMLEGYSALAFVAGQTERIELGTLVTCAIYRHPGMLVKILSSLDVLSGGRMILGIGAGWNEEEAHGLGIPFPPLAERFERFEEVLEIAHQMWRGDEQAYAGGHYHLARPINSPNALRRPHPPILIGGGGEKKTLRLVARYGDMCNLFDAPGPAGRGELARKLEVLAGHCEDLGRDYGEIEKTVISFVDLSTDPKAAAGRLLEHLGELAELGIGYALLAPAAPWDEPMIDAVAAVLDDVHGIASARP